MMNRYGEVETKIEHPWLIDILGESQDKKKIDSLPSTKLKKKKKEKKDMGEIKERAKMDLISQR